MNFNLFQEHCDLDCGVHRLETPTDWQKQTHIQAAY